MELERLNAKRSMNLENRDVGNLDKRRDGEMGRKKKKKLTVLLSATSNGISVMTL